MSDERRAGALILDANRLNNMGRLEESVPLYLDALGFPIDARSRFVILLNLGKVYLALSETDKVLRKQRRHNAVQAWLEALTLEEGGGDRGKVALWTGDLYMEDGKLSRASNMFRLVLEYDTPATTLSKTAHEKLGLTNRVFREAVGEDVAFQRSVLL